MTVIAFRPRPRPRADMPTPTDAQTSFAGTFRSPRGRTGSMTGHLRVLKLVITPRGAFVTGVFTGELREPDGALIGIDSRRCTVAANLQRRDGGLRAEVRPMRLDLMGISVHVPAFLVGAEVAFPSTTDGLRRRRRPSPALRVVPSS